LPDNPNYVTITEIVVGKPG